jgi:hypothetical protein|tara:strand:+ start:693 stop:920 length:228 start_codon:yes stop_codon:yes gene_type:complete
MATVNNWIDHLNKPAEEVAGAIYPGVGTEGILVIIGFVLWIGWHVISSKQESEKLEKLARRRPGANDWKNNVTDG